jgi:hypothetical protein
MVEPKIPSGLKVGVFGKLWQLYLNLFRGDVWGPLEGVAKNPGACSL